MEKRPHLHLIEGGNSTESCNVDRFRKALEQHDVIYYAAWQLDDEMRARLDQLDSYTLPEAYCKLDSPARDHWNALKGERGWALTPTVNRDGQVVQGFVDVVGLPSDRTTVADMIGSVSMHVVQGEGPPPLRPVED